MKFKFFLFASLLLVSCLMVAGTDENKTPAILIVVTNHGELGETGEPTGYFLSEVAHPWHVFKEAGYAVEFASPEGGFAPMDPKSFDLDDPVNQKLWQDLDAVQRLVHTRDLGDLDLSSYSAVFFAGGHGTMWDFPEDADVAGAVRTFIESGRPVGAVCHGPAALVNVTLSSGEPLLKGRKVNAFTDEEEARVDLVEEMPFLLESRMRDLGAHFTESAPFQKHVAVDGLLVTGQNPASATATAEAVIKLLQATP